MTRMMLPSCQAHSVEFKPAVLCSQAVLPCCPCSTNQTSTKRCLEVAALARLSAVRYRLCFMGCPGQLLPLPRHLEAPTIPRSALATHRGAGGGWRGVQHGTRLGREITYILRHVHGGGGGEKMFCEI